MDRLRLDVLNYYSGGNPRCACCGEATIKFLAIDHIDGGGNAHRTKIRAAGLTTYLWLRKMGFPDGFRVLCHNCNLAYGFYGDCPHNEKAEIGRA